MTEATAPATGHAATNRGARVRTTPRAAQAAALLGVVAAAVVAGTLWGVGAAGLLVTSAGVAAIGAHRAGLRTAQLEAASLAHATATIVDTPLTSLPDAAEFGTLAPVAEQIRTLQSRLETAIEAATTDRLTHVANRPMLLAKLYDEVERSSRYGRPLTVGFIDIDHFKPINDTYGHEVGDVVLRGVAEMLRENVRRSDIVGRYGGEEFVVVFPETTVDEATAVAEKLRVLIARQEFELSQAESVSVSVSIGLAGGHGQLLRVDDLLRDADAAMYAAKSLGRNQTYVFAELDDDSARIPRAPISPAARAAAMEIAEQGRRAAEAALASVIMPLPHYRGKPSSLIATIAVRLAQQLDLPDAEVERIRVASLLHDIGKVGVPDEILEKPGPLSPDEWQSVVQHPRIGQEILNRVAAVKDAAAIILHHHERFSGHGYPHGLRGADIPLGARIVAIADAYEAMRSDRPYRKAVSHEAAINELRAMAGIQFDPDLVELFCSLYGEVQPLADPSLLITPLDDMAQTSTPAARARRRNSG